MNEFQGVYPARPPDDDMPPKFEGQEKVKKLIRDDIMNSLKFKRGRFLAQIWERMKHWVYE